MIESDINALELMYQNYFILKVYWILILKTGIYISFFLLFKAEARFKGMRYFVRKKNILNSAPFMKIKRNDFFYRNIVTLIFRD